MKNYIKPQVNVIDIELTQVVAMSNPFVFDAPADDSPIQVRGRNAFLFDDDEEDDW